MPAKKWTREIIIASIQKIHETGGKLNSNYAQKRRRKLYLAACAYCGSWKSAVEAAGISYETVKAPRPEPRKWSREKVLREIKKLYLKGQPINSNHVQLHSAKTKRLYGAAVKYFGSWGEAVQSAGFDYTSIRIRSFRLWNNVRVADAIKERVGKGKSVNGTAVYQEDRGLYLAAKRYIGGWKKALRRAGINPKSLPDPRRVWTKERIVEEVLSLHEKGISLYGYFLVQNGRQNLFGAGCKLFGSWRNVIRAAGLRYADVRKSRFGWWTPKRVLQGIRRLEKSGIRLSSKAIQLRRGGLFQAAVVYFGSWGQAVEAAGFDYSKHTKIWSSKAWVRKLTDSEADEIIRQSLRMSKIRARR